MCLLVWGWLGLFNMQTGSILYRSYNKISPRQSWLIQANKPESWIRKIILKLTNSVMYISLMVKILNSPKGVKSGVLDRVIIFAAHVAPVTSLCTQTDDPITNDRCIHRACSYSRAHLPGNGMVRYTLFKSTGYNLILYVCPRDVNKLWRVSTSYNFLLYQLHFYKWLWQDHILGYVPCIASYVLPTMVWCISRCHIVVLL